MPSPPRMPPRGPTLRPDVVLRPEVIGVPRRTPPTPATPPRTTPPVLTPPRATPPVLTPRAPIAPPALPARARLDALIAELREMKGRMAAMVYRSGQIFAELRTQEMLDVAGCASFDELLAKFDLTNRFTASKYILVAQTFDEPTAISLGVEKGYELVRYAEALGTPATTLLARRARVAGVELVTATAQQLRAALRAIADERRATRDAEDDTKEEVDRTVRKLGPALRRAGARGAKLRRVKRRGAWVLLIELDPDEAASVIEKLARK